MGLNMRIVMRLAIEWVFPATPMGFIGMVVSFVGRGSIAFHRLPNIHRPYGTLRH